jgi:metal-sulfur cluster biosynthetic enzyme
MSKITKEKIIEALRPIKDPEIHIGIVDLGLIYSVEVKENNDVDIRMTLTTPGCPVGPELVSAVEMTAKTIDGVGKVNVELVWDPPYDPHEMASDYAKDELGIW